MITMERYEKSLLQIIDEYRNPPSADEFKSPYDRYLEMAQKEAEEPPAKPVVNVVETGPVAIQIPPFEPKTISLEPQIPPASPDASRGEKEDFIRFACSCGKHLKMPAKYAGRMGKCPKCNARLKIPDK
jgi:hypothetical protein